MPSAYNTTVGPIQVSADGRVIGGGESGQVDPTDEYAARGLASGALVIDEPAPAPKAPKAADKEA